jgi:hypothetical protein
MGFSKMLMALSALCMLAGCAGTEQDGVTHAAAIRHMGVPKGAIGRDHSVLTDDLPRALHEQRRTDIATP